MRCLNQRVIEGEGWRDEDEKGFACSDAKPIFGTLQPVEADSYLELVVVARPSGLPKDLDTIIGSVRDLSKLFPSEPERIDHQLRP